MYKKIVLLVCCLLLVIPSAMYAGAQAPQDPVTGEVIYHQVHIRNGNGRAFTSLGLLARGAVVTVHAHAWAPDYYRRWTLVTTADNLSGWIRSDLLRYSDAQWRETVPEWDLTTVERYLRDTDSVGYFMREVQAGGSRVNVRAEPWLGAKIINQVEHGTFVTLLAQSAEGGYGTYGGWVYIRQLESGLEGWMMADAVSFYSAAQFRPATRSDALPVIVHETPVKGYGVVTLRMQGVTLFAEPSSGSPQQHLLASTDRVYLLGRAPEDFDAQGRWLYVEDHVSGQRGWLMEGPYQEGLALDYMPWHAVQTLPVVQPVVNPELPGGLEPLAGLNVALEGSLRLYGTPTLAARDTITVGTNPGTPLSITVIGHRIDTEWTYVEVNGQQGWVPLNALPLATSDVNRLPVID